MTHVFRELFEAVVLALLIFFLIQGSIENFKVEGSSMRPELSGGEYVMVNKISFIRVDMRRLSDLVPFWDAEEKKSHLPLTGPPERGDVIVFHAPVRPPKDFGEAGYRSSRGDCGDTFRGGLHQRSRA